MYEKKKQAYLDERFLSLEIGIIDEISILDLAPTAVREMGSNGIVLNSSIARGGEEGEGNLQRSVNRLHSIEQMKNNKRHSWTLKELPRGENCASLPLLIIISISVPESVPCTENYKTNQLPLPFPSSLSRKYVFRKIS